jgi:NAD(P)-dependent dehydrogenase (short-subunit alcohol dehydrogenase family)
MTYVLQGKLAIITGASQGLGLEIAKHFAQQGASLVLCARNLQSLQKVKQALAAELLAEQRIEIIAADVAKEADVEQVLALALEQGQGIDILVNNAGILGPTGLVEETDWSAWVHTVAVNLQGSVLMARAVLPSMKKQRKGKIIQLSGGGAAKALPRMSAYAASKAAIVRFAETLAVEVEADGIDVNAIAPGVLDTNMLNECIEAGPERVGQAYYDDVLARRESSADNLASTVKLATFLASEASDGISGKLISAIWDHWQDWPQYREHLAKSDAYTLRRIVGRDRGFLWGDK